MAQIDPSNPLLSFMSEATTNLQQALSKQGKRKKVNHRRYLIKRLKHEGKASGASAKPKTQQKPVAPAPASQLPPMTTNLPSWQPPSLPELPPLPAYDFYPRNEVPYPSPPTAQEFDPELEELLTEIGLDSPSQCSQYSCVDSPASLTRGAVASQAAPTSSLSYSTFLTSDLRDNHLSPPSDFSDIDDSYPSYPSSRSDSPAYQSPNQLPPSCSSHQVYGSCEWLPMPAVPSHPAVPVTPLLNELLGYYPVPEHC